MLWRLWMNLQPILLVLQMRLTTGLRNQNFQGILDILTSAWIRYIQQKNLGPGWFQESISVEPTGSHKSLSLCSIIAAKRKHQQMGPEYATPVESMGKGVAKAGQANEHCSQSTFRSVAEISSAGDRSSGFGSVDVGKAMKGMAAIESSVAIGIPTNSSEQCADPSLTGFGKFCLPGGKAPLDFTLKTSMRVVSSAAASRIHKSITRSAYSMLKSKFNSDSFDNQNISRCSGFASTSEVIDVKLLHSWVYPQFTLPPSLIQILTSSTAEGVETDFLTKRHIAWEDSFRSLYYMFRKGACNIFYVCTRFFVVMFTGRDVAVGTKRVSNAYISQSTRVMQSLLRENDVSFSMLLCRSKVDQVTSEVFVELSELQELGQTRRMRSLIDIDNTPESLLVINGNNNVHGLFDVLLNYRSFMTALIGADVPVLYSPVPFQNAAISSPQVKCMDLKRVDQMLPSKKGSTAEDVGSTPSISAGLCSSVEIKDAFIPPWIISNVCAVVGSEGGSFEARPSSREIRLSRCSSSRLAKQQFWYFGSHRNSFLAVGFTEKFEVYKWFLYGFCFSPPWTPNSRMIIWLYSPSSSILHPEQIFGIAFSCVIVVPVKVYHKEPQKDYVQDSIQAQVYF